MKNLAKFVLPFMIIALGCTKNPKNTDNRQPPLSGRSVIPNPPSFGLEAIQRYQNCDALKQDLYKDMLQRMQVDWQAATYYKSHSNEDQGASPDNGTILNNASTNSMPEQEASSDSSQNQSTMSTAGNVVSTNVQVKGIDEHDEIKMNNKFIFIADNQPNSTNFSIAIVDKNKLAKVGSIDLPLLSSPQLYTGDDRLIVTGMQVRPYDPKRPSQSNEFTVKVYDVNNQPILKSELFMASMPVDSRMIGDRFFAVLKTSIQQKNVLYYPNTNDLFSTFENYAGKLDLNKTFDFTEDTFNGIKCTSMLPVHGVGPEFFVQEVISFDTNSGDVLDEVAIPGNDAGIYMTEKNIYSYGRPLAPKVWVHPQDLEGQKVWNDMTAKINDTLNLTKIAFDIETGKLTPLAIGQIDGHLKSFDASWAFNEMTTADQTVLAVVTSKGDVKDQTGKNPASNLLTILSQQGQKLVEAASIKEFAKNEDVRSVRFIGSRAYVVTFKRTDPLFTIDLENPLAPKMIGELKIPGFSLYLHPHANDRLLGLGYQTEESGETDINRAFFQGVLFQLFDISNPSAPTRLNYVELGKRGSYTEANQDHHAFYYDAENALAAVPVVLFDDSLASGDDQRPPNQGRPINRTSLPPNNGQINHWTRSFSGAIFYRILADKLAEVKRISHFDLLGPNCRANLSPLTWTSPIVANPEVRRIFRDGNMIYAVSNVAVSAIDATTLQEVGRISLERLDCPMQQINQGFE